MWAEIMAPNRVSLAVRIWLRKVRLFWRRRAGLRWLLAWAAAFSVYLAVGLQPVRAKDYEISGRLEIPEIGLATEVARLEVENGRLETPALIAGSYQRSQNKTLIIGHSTGVFKGLDELDVGEQVEYGGEKYIVYKRETLAKGEVNMGEVLMPAEKATLVLMTCAGELLPGGDATERLVVSAARS